jgi:hypothetical protein
MTNAWELLLKAKWLADHGEAVETLYDMTKDKTGDQKPKENRSGNPISVGLTYLAAAMVADKKTGLEKAAQENLLALVEIRDNAAHLINKDPYIGRRVQEVGTASLRNYLLLAASWFKLDLSQYNFFLMPISFYHGFEAAEPATRADYPVQVQKLLAYLDARKATDTDDAGGQHVALRLETRLVRGKDTAAVEFRYTDDPNAPAIAMRQEDILKNYPMTFSPPRSPRGIRTSWLTRSITGYAELLRLSASSAFRIRSIQPSRRAPSSASTTATSSRNSTSITRATRPSEVVCQSIAAQRTFPRSGTASGYLIWRG